MEKIETYAQRRNRTIKNRYGIDNNEYRAMKIMQNNKCAICFQIFDKFDIDHDHRTGVVRGLLCRRCNLLVGFHEKSPHLFRKIQRYTKRFADL